VRSSYVCELVHYVREPQLHVALRPRAPPSRDDAQLDDDDERRRDDERRLSDDAPAPDALVISPSEFLPFLVIKRTDHTMRRLFRRSVSVRLAVHKVVIGLSQVGRRAVLRGEMSALARPQETAHNARGVNVDRLG
jgi:hypothetical protein